MKYSAIFIIAVVSECLSLAVHGMVDTYTITTETDSSRWSVKQYNYHLARRYQECPQCKEDKQKLKAALWKALADPSVTIMSDDDWEKRKKDEEEAEAAAEAAREEAERKREQREVFEKFADVIEYHQQQNPMFNGERPDLLDPRTSVDPERLAKQQDKRKNPVKYAVKELKRFYKYYGVEGKTDEWITKAATQFVRENKLKAMWKTLEEKYGPRSAVPNDEEDETAAPTQATEEL